jgi:release factor glutamine methyltransferase
MDGFVEPAVTIGEALVEARRSLTDAGVDSPALDARLLLEHALAVDTATVIGHPERLLDGAGRRRLAEFVARRRRREPLATIVGVREFWSLPIAVTADTLVPCPDSETVIEAALDWVGERNAALRVLDLGTGSGCLLLALLSELPRAHGIGIDNSPAAIAVARKNATDLGFVGRARFTVGDWATAVAGTFDIVVANLPYVPSAERSRLAPEVTAYEPDSAVFAGADGLEAFRQVIPDLARLLGPGAAAFLEIGVDQGASVAGLSRECGLQFIEIKEDLSRIPRCVAVAPQVAAAT